MRANEVVVLQVNIDGLDDVLNTYSAFLGRPKIEKIIKQTNLDTARRMKTMLKRLAANDYVVTQKWAAEQIGGWESSGRLGFKVPLKGARGVIGETFKANRINKKRKSKKHPEADGRATTASVQIRRGAGRSHISTANKVQGGGPVFFAGGTLYTRHRGQTVRVVARSLPQIIVDSPTSEKVGEEMAEYMEKRLDHHIQRALGGNI